MTWLAAGMTAVALSCSNAVASPAAEQLTVEETAAAVDALFRQAWERDSVTPAQPADDAEFLRRLYLDLAGRIPSIAEARSFLADSSPGKRRELVEQLLDQPAAVRHATISWRNSLIPREFQEPQVRVQLPGFEAWLWSRLAENRPYDEWVRELVTADLNDANGQVLNSATSPDAFFLAREVRPEQLATGISRAFLGVRLDCAQCHDHPFDRWTQQQFWNLAAFYAGYGTDTPDDEATPMMRLSPDKSIRSIEVPGTGELVPATYLTGVEPDWAAIDDPRIALADWLTAPENPWFARMAANRVWAGFFGRGLVDPVDDFSDLNPPSHPEVLELLAEQFKAHSYDQQFLVRAIVSTRLYQLSSRQSHPSQAAPEQFARMPLRGLTPEQLFDSLAEAVGYYQPFQSGNPFVLEDNSPRTRFLGEFRDVAASPSDRETTILQALSMMNDELITDATDVENSRLLAAVTRFPLMTDAERLDALFLAVLTRYPTDEERSRFDSYVHDSDSRTEPTEQDFADLFWVLLNSSEFLLNH